MDDWKHLEEQAEGLLLQRMQLSESVLRLFDCEPHKYSQAEAALWAESYNAAEEELIKRGFYTGWSE